jgi:hypothetical protein
MVRPVREVLKTVCRLEGKELDAVAALYDAIREMKEQGSLSIAGAMERARSI